MNCSEYENTKSEMQKINKWRMIIERQTVLESGFA